jgi:hypothetical protein
MLHTEEQVVETLDQQEEQQIVELSQIDLQWVGGGGAAGMTF